MKETTGWGDINHQRVADYYVFLKSIGRAFLCDKL